MRMYTLSLLSVVLAAFGGVSVYASTAYSDVSDTHLDRRAIAYLRNVGIMTGYPDGTFGISKGINRAEFLKILVEAQEEKPSSEYYKNCYPDVTDQWFAPYVCFATESGWVKGNPDGMFRPEQGVNIAEALKMIVEIRGYPLPQEGTYSFSFGHFTEGYGWDQKAWYAPYLMSALQRYIVTLEDIGGKSPGYTLMRFTAAEYLYRTLMSEGEIAFTFPMHRCGDGVTSFRIEEEATSIVGAGLHVKQELKGIAADGTECTLASDVNPYNGGMQYSDAWSLKPVNVHLEPYENAYGDIPFREDIAYFQTMDRNAEKIPFYWNYDLTTNTLWQRTNFKGIQTPSIPD